ncbi:MAG TPA: GlsB/YeaQ/YmgE family stress response membrane protein [Kofleriaceae bacterium]|nr:GlsB/YeaQ/YmgE family stress response membrane protein [Kofleriaceae bacterium]
MDDVFGQHSILYIILIGFFAGLLARAIMPGRQGYGFIVTTLLGIGGAVLATYAGQALELYQPGQRARFLGAVVGALVLLVIANLVRRRD